MSEGRLSQTGRLKAERLVVVCGADVTGRYRWLPARRAGDAGKLTLALDAMSDADLRAAGVATMPFPGLDHGNSALVSLRRRLPMLGTFGSRRAGPGLAVHLPERLDLGSGAQLDTALTVLIGRLLGDVACELARAVGALARIEGSISRSQTMVPSRRRRRGRTS